MNCQFIEHPHTLTDPTDLYCGIILTRKTEAKFSTLFYHGQRHSIRKNSFSVVFPPEMTYADKCAKGRYGYQKG